MFLSKKSIRILNAQEASSSSSIVRPVYNISVDRDLNLPHTYASIRKLEIITSDKKKVDAQAWHVYADASVVAALDMTGKSTTSFQYKLHLAEELLAKMMVEFYGLKDDDVKVNLHKAGYTSWIDINKPETALDVDPDEANKRLSNFLSKTDLKSYLPTGARVKNAIVKGVDSSAVEQVLNGGSEQSKNVKNKLLKENNNQNFAFNKIKNLFQQKLNNLK